MRTIPILLFVFICSCVEQIDFSAPSDVGVLVVDGQLSTMDTVHKITLSRTDRLGKQVFPPEDNATIVLFDEMNNSDQFLNVGNGQYELSSEKITPRVGGTYSIEITTQNGSVYQSMPEIIYPVPEIKDFSHHVTIEQELVDETRVLERSFFNLSVSTDIDVPDQTFLKWDVEHVYIVTEISCGPLSAPKSCYIYQPINENLFFLLDGRRVAQGSEFSEQVVHQPLDVSFGLAASFYVSQKSLTQRSFEYWQDVDRVVNNAGSIFEAPSAPVKGNIISVNNPGEQVLGFFSAVDEKRKLIIITRADLDTPYPPLPFCGVPGFPPEPLPPPCCNCLILENSSTERPDYWP